MIGDTVHIDVIDKRRQHVHRDAVGRLAAVLAGHSRISASRSARAAQMFWLDEGLPASLAPGKRPRSTLSVGMALREGKPYMSWGTPGGDQQDQWSCQFFLRHARKRATPKMNLQEAIDAPAWHIEHFPLRSGRARPAPACWWPKAACRKATIKDLERRGHKVEVGPDWSEGRLTAAEPGRRAPQSRRQRARHAGLRGGAVSQHKPGLAAPRRSMFPSPRGNIGGQR